MKNEIWFFENLDFIGLRLVFLVFFYLELGVWFEDFYF